MRLIGYFCKFEIRCIFSLFQLFWWHRLGHQHRLLYLFFINLFICSPSATSNKVLLLRLIGRKLLSVFNVIFERESMSVAIIYLCLQQLNVLNQIFSLLDQEISFCSILLLLLSRHQNTSSIEWTVYKVGSLRARLWLVYKICESLGCSSGKSAIVWLRWWVSLCGLPSLSGGSWSRSALRIIIYWAFGFFLTASTLQLLWSRLFGYESNNFFASSLSVSNILVLEIW